MRGPLRETSAPERSGGSGDADVELAREFADIAQLLAAGQNAGATLQKVCALAVEHIRGCDHAGISLIERHRIHTRGSTDQVPTIVDRIQYESGEGPCLDAIRTMEVVRVDDLLTDGRWPRFARPAVDASGVRSMLAFRLFVAPGPDPGASATIGALNLYSRRPGALGGDRHAVDLGLIFASHAAVALAGARALDNLRLALETREVIGMAVGLLMARQEVDRHEALDMLRRASQRENVKLRDIALRLVDPGGAGPAESAPPATPPTDVGLPVSDG